MKKLAFLLLLAAPLPAAADPDAILGVWQIAPTDHGFALVEVTQRHGRYEGRVVWLSEPDFAATDPEAGRPKTDRYNPDPKLRSEPILGMSLMSGFRYSGGAWKGGRIYDPESGRTYRGSIRMGDNGTLKLRGYIGIPLIGRTSVWVRSARLDE